MANTPAMGNGPFEFTDSNDRQVSIPISAFSFDSNSKLQVTADWQAVVTAQPAAALLAYMQAEGLLSPAAAPSTFPAMIANAADPGAGGNNITVTISNIVPATDPTQTTFTVTVTENDLYTGLTAATMEQTLGSSAVTGSSPGLVQVKHGSVDPFGVPHSTSGVLTGSPLHMDVLGTGSPPKVFTLLAKKSGADGGLTHVTVTPDSASPSPTVETFSLHATWTKNATATLLTLASVVQSQLSYEISVALPGSGAYSLPAAAATTLSGGAPGASASATLFTGI